MRIIPDSVLLEKWVLFNSIWAGVDNGTIFQSHIARWLWMFDYVLLSHLVPGVKNSVNTLVIVCNILHPHSQINILIVISYLRSVALQAPLFLSHPRYARPSARFFFNARPLFSLYFRHAINHTQLALPAPNREWCILLGSKVKTCLLMPKLSIYTDSG